MSQTDKSEGAIATIKRHPIVSTALEVQLRFVELRGSDAASAITLSLFLSVFPLILVAVTVLGYVADGNETFVTDAIADLGLTGQAKEMFTNLIASSQNNRGALTAIALIGGAWSGLGVSIALQKAANLGWQASSLGIKDRGKAVLFLLGGGVLAGASVAMTAAVRALPGWLAPINIVVSIAVSTAIFAWLFWFLCSFKLSLRTVLPGSIVGALGFEVLKWLATNWLPGVIAKSSAVYGSIGTIFGTFAWLMLLGKLLTYASIVNVVLAERSTGTASLSIQVPQIATQWATDSTARGGFVKKPKKPLVLPWKKGAKPS